MISASPGPKADKIYVPLLGVRCELSNFMIGPLRFVHLDDAVAASMKADALSFLGPEPPVGPLKGFISQIDSTVDELTGTTALLYECETSHVGS